MSFELQISSPQQGQFLKRIEWNREAFQAQIKEIAEKYRGELQIKTPEDKKRAKDDRATLNAMLNTIESRRKTIKAAIMEPYDIFAGELAECTEALEFARDAIDDQIKAAEKREKTEKISQIKEYWQSKRPETTGPFKKLTEWERIRKPEWETTRCTIKKACADIDAAFERALQDLQAIEGCGEDRTMKNIMTDKLVETGEVREAFALAARIRQEDEERRRREEEQELRRQEAERERARARMDAEDAARRDAVNQSAQDKLGALRERLGRGKPPEGEGQGNGPGQQEKPATAAQSGQEVPSEGDVRRGYRADPSDQGAAGDDAQARAGQAPGNSQEQKIYKAAFWVAGTKAQLKDLADYIKDMGLAGYGSIKQGAKANG